MSENKEIAIQLSGVKKMYKLGQIGGGTLQGDLQSWWARVKGKEDPNTKIGQEQRLVGQTFMALNGIDLTVYKGEALGIIGANGAGKSTMLKLLSRVTAPSNGEIDIYGRITSMLEVGTGFNGEMTGRENIYMNGAILGMTKEEIDAKMEDIIEFSEVREFIDTPVKRYSSGMYVKLAFSVAAHLDSEIMIMDEVLAVGDMAFQKKCLTKMRETANKEGRTVLYVSHNMNTIRQLCNRCIVLDKGKIAFDGDVEEAITVYSNQKAQIGNLFDYSMCKRSPNESRKLQLLGLEFVNGEMGKFSKNERIRIILHTITNKNIENVGIRFELFYSDDNIVGTVFSNEKLTRKAGQKLDLYYTINFCGLAPGKYYAVALAYEFNEFGEQVGIDRVEPAMIFEIKEGSDLVWLHRYWGYIEFEPMLLTDVIEK